MKHYIATVGEKLIRVHVHAVANTVLSCKSCTQFSKYDYVYPSN